MERRKGKGMEHNTGKRFNKRIKKTCDERPGEKGWKTE